MFTHADKRYLDVPFCSQVLELVVVNGTMFSLQVLMLFLCGNHLDGSSQGDTSVGINNAH